MQDSLNVFFGLDYSSIGGTGRNVVWTTEQHSGDEHIVEFASLVRAPVLKVERHFAAAVRAQVRGDIRLAGTDSLRLGIRVWSLLSQPKQLAFEAWVDRARIVP